MKAFDAIHELDVIHGDVREQNILVTDDESVFIIDFDHSYRLSEPIPVYPCEPIPTAEEYVAMEQKQIKVLFQQLKSQKSGMR
jgi:DNA-binding helix-hairpin-helix protein with protein kinase domain